MMLAATAAFAQQPGQPSIAEVSRQTEASRASTATKKAQKSYTNKDLHAVPAAETAAPAAAVDTTKTSTGKDASADAKGQGDASSPADAGAVDAATAAKMNAVPEQMWRARAGRIREQAAALQETIQQIRARPKAPNPARQEQYDKEEARMVTAMGALKKQWAALESQARDQKIDLTWLEPLPAFPQ